jgi:hypothetical protein
VELDIPFHSLKLLPRDVSQSRAHLIASPSSLQVSRVGGRLSHSRRSCSQQEPKLETIPIPSTIPNLPLNSTHPLGLLRKPFLPFNESVCDPGTPGIALCYSPRLLGVTSSLRPFPSRTHPVPSPPPADVVCFSPVRTLSLAREPFDVPRRRSPSPLEGQPFATLCAPRRYTDHFSSLTVS